MIIRDAYRSCESDRFKKNGHIHNGKQSHPCKDCGRQFVLQPDNRVIDDDQRALVERLLREKLSLHGISRAVGVSIWWLMNFIVERFEAAPGHLYVQLPVRPGDVIIRRFEAEADEMHSFVKKKANEKWIWLAMDRRARQVISFHVGDRSRKSAEQIWANLPAVYREQATFYTDQYTDRTVL